MEDIKLMYALTKALATTMANETKKEIKNPELATFIKDLEDLSTRAEKIIAKSKSTFNYKEFKGFIATCSVLAMGLDEVFHDYIHQDLEKLTKPNGGKKHGK